jgi:tol-pal system protein YbgF
MKISIPVIFFSAFLLFGCNTSQRDLTIIDTRVTRLEQRMVDLIRSNNAKIESYEQAKKKHEQKLRNQSAGVKANLERLEEQVRALNGRIDEFDHRQQMQPANPDPAKAKKDESRLNIIESQIIAESQRIQKLENYLNLDTTRIAAAKPEKKSQPTARAAKPLSQSDLYQTAKQSFDKANYEEARKAFNQYLKLYPKSEHADNAQFWIGESYFQEKWYEKALIEYQNVIENYPKGNKVTAAYLKQGLAFNNIGDKANARLVLQELIKKFPYSNEAKIAKKKLQVLK